MQAATERVPLDDLDERYRELRLERPEIVGAVRRSIERDGLRHPLVANRQPDGRLVLLDGFKRLRVLRDLGHEDVLVRVVHLDEAAARAALLTYNAPHRGLLEIEEAWVVHSLVRGCTLRQADVGALLGRHKSWVCRRLALAERLDERVQEDMRLGLVPPTVGRELVRLPRGNHARVAEVVRQHKLTSRQSALLVDACFACDDPQILDGILDDPLRYLAPMAELGRPLPPRDPRLSAHGEAVRQRLVRMDRAVLAVSQILRERPHSRFVGDDLTILHDLASPLSERTKEAAASLVELCEEAGHADA